LIIGIFRFNHLKFKLKKYYLNANIEQPKTNKNESDT
jgi:hypothetical protein